MRNFHFQDRFNIAVHRVLSFVCIETVAITCIWTFGLNTFGFVFPRCEYFVVGRLFVVLFAPGRIETFTLE